MITAVLSLLLTFLAPPQKITLQELKIEREVFFEWEHAEGVIEGYNVEIQIQDPQADRTPTNDFDNADESEHELGQGEIGYYLIKLEYTNQIKIPIKKEYQVRIRVQAFAGNSFSFYTEWTDWK